jgi:hypothetical protein
MQVSQAIAVAVLCFSSGRALEPQHANNTEPGDPFGPENFEYVFHLFSNGTEVDEAAFHQVYNHFLKEFDFKTYARFLGIMEKSFQRYKESPEMTAYTTIPGQPHCDTGLVGPKVLKPNRAKVGGFPGGSLVRMFGFDFSKFMFDLQKKAQGPAGAQQGQVTSMAMTGLQVGMGMIQAMMGSILDIVPPMIPPPIWINMPLPCLPMLTGKNCFGAVLFPISTIDFTMADATDRQLDGYIAGFPNSYATKVGKTDDTLYKTCFIAFMSMHCSAIFPRCTVPMSRNEPIPFGGRVPMCFHLCITTLVACPGFWISDILGPCMMISVPPMCTMAFFWNVWLLPPQYTSYSEDAGYPKDCPPLDTGVGGEDMGAEPELFDEVEIADSPILAAAGASVKLPPVLAHKAILVNSGAN